DRLPASSRERIIDVARSARRPVGGRADPGERRRVVDGGNRVTAAVATVRPLGIAPLIAVLVGFARERSAPLSGRLTAACGSRLRPADLVVAAAVVVFQLDHSLGAEVLQQIRE